MMQVGGRFTEMVGCAVPIQCAAMAGIATPELAAAVSNAGGLGMPAAGRRSDVLRAQIDATRSLTDRPFGVGFIVEFLDRDALDVAYGEVPVIELFWGWRCGRRARRGGHMPGEGQTPSGNVRER
jgi:nitronate monooxygenase